MYCSKCGKEVSSEQAFCPNCGASTRGNSDTGKEWLITMLLCFFLGVIGAHRFYTGYIGIGVLQLLTFGGCGLWVLIDFIMILCGKYQTSDGKDLVK